MWKMKVFNYFGNERPKVPLEEQVLQFLNEKALPPERVKITIAFAPGGEAIFRAIVYYYEG